MVSKNLLTLVFLVLASLAFALADDTEEKYTSKYDDIDAESILLNDKLRNQYLNCYMETGPCLTADAKFLKEKFSEAFMTNCKKCSEKQVRMFDKISVWYTENEPDTWKRVIEKSINDMKDKQGTSGTK